MRRFVIENKEGVLVSLPADHIEVYDKVLYAYVIGEGKPRRLVGVFREYAACWVVEERSETPQ